MIISLTPHPEKVNRLILVAASCGGKESIPPSPQVVKFFTELVNKSINNIPITPQEVKILLSLPMGSAWMKSHPNFLQAVPEAKDLFASIPPNTIKQQNDISQNWLATNWTGVCDELTRVSSPTLIITGTQDNNVPSANSLIIAGEIPGAWLIQIKDAGHALFVQYPDEVNRVLQTFLSTTTNSGLRIYYLVTALTLPLSLCSSHIFSGPTTSLPPYVYDCCTEVFFPLPTDNT